jgi:hypothetical protein
MKKRERQTCQGKGREGRFVYWNDQEVPAVKRQRNDYQASSAVNDQSDNTMDSAPQDNTSVRSHHRLPPAR